MRGPNHRPLLQRAAVVLLAAALLAAEPALPATTATAAPGDGGGAATLASTGDGHGGVDVGDHLDITVGPDVATGFNLPPQAQATTGRTTISGVHVTNTGAELDGRVGLELEIRRDGGITSDDVRLVERFGGEELQLEADGGALRAPIASRVRLGTLTTAVRGHELTVHRAGTYTFTSRVVDADGVVVATSAQVLEVTDPTGPVTRGAALGPQAERDVAQAAGLELEPRPGTTTDTLRRRAAALLDLPADAVVPTVGAEKESASGMVSFDLRPTVSNAPMTAPLTAPTAPPGTAPMAVPMAVPMAQAAQAVEALVDEGLVRSGNAVPLFATATVPDDPLFDQQWSLHGPDDGPGHGIDAPAAWTHTLGNEDVVVAVVDTGGLAHPDLVDRTVPGANLVTEEADDRQIPEDGTDPGTWVAADDGRLLQASSWHGTHVAGIIGASTDNARGIAGVDQRARIQHVRAMGVGGQGHPTDIANAIRWAAGLPVAGVALNPTPAAVINLSIAGPGFCPSVLQTAVDDAVEAGAVVVAASGNQGLDLRVAPFSPLSCDGVLGVTATDERGARASYANAGRFHGLAAPGGDQRAIISTYNPGQREAETDPLGRPVDNYAGQVGTSMAAPHVAGVASLVLAADPRLDPAQVTAVLQAPESVRTFATDSIETHRRCSDDPFATESAYCGAGMLDAGRAVATAADLSTVVTLSGPQVVDTGVATTPVNATVTNLSSDDLPARGLELAISSADGPADLDLEVETDIGWLPVDTAADGDGRVTATVPVAALRAGDSTEVAVRLTGHRDARLRVTARLGGDAPEELLPAAVDTGRSTFHLDPGSFVEGDDDGARAEVVLRDADGAPIADRALTLTATPDDAVTVEEPTVTTDDQGRATFRIRSQAAGTVELTISDGATTLGPRSLTVTHAPLQPPDTAPGVPAGGIACDGARLGHDEVGLDDPTAVTARCQGVEVRLGDLTTPDAQRSGRVVVLRPAGTWTLGLDAVEAGTEVAAWLRDTGPDGSSAAAPELARIDSTTGGTTSLRLTTPAASTPGEHLLHLAWRTPEGTRHTVEVAVLVAPPAFSDVDPGSVHAPAIARVAALGITTGYADGTFGPGDAVRRGQLAAFLARTLELEPVEDPPELTDIDGSVHADAVRAVVGHGYASGYTDGRFGIGDPVRRDQMATMLAGAAALTPQASGPFTDLDGNVHAERVNALVAAGLTQGVTADRYDPTGTVRRDQLATFLVRLLDHLDGAV